MAEEQNTGDLPEVENIDMKEELTKLEDEINTLKQVLQSKETQAAELRKKLGITFGAQFKQSIDQIASSDTILNAENNVKKFYYRAKTNPKVLEGTKKMNEIGDSLGRAFTGFGQSASTKLTEMKSSPSFQSFEQKVGGIFGRNSQQQTPQATSPTTEPAKE
jgi:Sec-independent protein translocase protein TatA